MHHKWVEINQPLGFIEYGTRSIRVKWKCMKCSTLTNVINKPKRRKDYKMAGIGETCELELARQIHES
jgi:hypothetical protein